MSQPRPPGLCLCARLVATCVNSSIPVHEPRVALLHSNRRMFENNFVWRSNLKSKDRKSGPNFVRELTRSEFPGPGQAQNFTKPDPNWAILTGRGGFCGLFLATLTNFSRTSRRVQHCQASQATSRYHICHECDHANRLLRSALLCFVWSVERLWMVQCVHWRCAYGYG